MSFSYDIKWELINSKFNSSKFKSFVKGFVLASGVKKEDKLWCKINSFDLIEKFKELLNNFKFQYQFEKGNFIFEAKKLNFKNITNFTSFYAGVFVARGSISKEEANSYHLEFSSNYQDYFNLIMERILKHEYDFHFNILTKKNKYVAYLKRVSSISTFLQGIGALNNYFIFEERKINRDMKSAMVKFTNLDVQNSLKIVNSSKQHCTYINFVYQKNLKYLFNEKELAFFDLKLEYPYLSLEGIKELLEKRNIYISKSGLNHWLIKLKKIYLNNKENK
ncbi:DNA-binding protein WhiA [Mycoplasmopsis pulmonis]|nr:DNA-binding protein WhiA [Mycoplasmopsis pulmonis]MDZ7293189.1 DNA-binding protein WhiA [Mycoplasmopsis pulmonis]VEU67987.1 Uncharacterized protein conserved in bacteria [Mycoplasmopsis pulmonis]